MTAARKPAQIDRDKLRAAIRRLGHEQVFYMLDEAIDLLSPAKLREIAGKYLDLESLCPDRGSRNKASLLADVEAFDKASRAGEYYESFAVNSRNFTMQSTGTTAWIADCNRLLDRCVAQAERGKPAEVRAAFDIIFRLLDHVDTGNDDIIFFADEGGAWAVGVDWETVLPTWFTVLSATAGPEDYAQRITALVGHRYSHRRDTMMAIARKTATPEQRKALAEALKRRTRGGPGASKS